MRKMEKDYYAVLGVDKKATKAEIKKAFREKAKQHHPDKGGDEKEFKKINEAYEVLGDDKKRANYDQFGSAGGGFGNGFSGASDFSGFGGGFSNVDFGGFEDIFSSFFGGGGGRQQKKASAARGSDLEVDVKISFEEALNGTEKTFSSKNYEPCAKCDGVGGSGKQKCSKCGGSGQVKQQFQTPFGTIAQTTTCPECHGAGESFKEVCKACKGEGRTEQKQKITVKIPAGVDSGETLRVREKGEAGVRGGTRGDLYVHVQVETSNKFQRRGLDLISELEISPFAALLGGTFPIQTFWGSVDLKIPENTKDGQLFRLNGKGVKRGSSSGDHIIKVKYKMPAKISAKLRDLLEQAEKEI